MAYIKHLWEDENVLYPNRYTVDGVQKTILRDVGTVTKQDPISASKLNNMEQGIYDAHTMLASTNGVLASTYYVSKTGNDNNNGLTAGTAFLTIGKALSIIPDIVKIATGTDYVDIIVGDGDYTAEGNVAIKFKSGAGIRLVGNATTPANVKLLSLTTTANRSLISVNGFDIKTVSAIAWYSYGDSLAVGSNIIVNGAALSYIGFLCYYGTLRITSCTVSNRGTAFHTGYNGKMTVGDVAGTGNNNGYESIIGGSMSIYGTEVSATIKYVQNSGGIITTQIDAHTLDGYHVNQLARLDTIPIFAGGLAGAEGGEIQLIKPASGTSLAGNVTIDVLNNKLRLFEYGGGYKGAFIDINTCWGSVGSELHHDAVYGNLIIATGSFTLSATDNHKVIYMNIGANATITIPLGLPPEFECTVIGCANGAYLVTFASGVASILSNPDSTKRTLNGAVAVAWLRRSVGDNTWFLTGNLKV